MIGNLARIAFRRPVSVLVVAFALVLMGRVAWKSLPIDLLPDLQSPTVLVLIRSGDRPPEEMERLYGEQVEQRLFTVSGIRDIEEVARSGRLIARVSFQWGRSMDLAVVDVQKALGSLRGDPDVDELTIRLFDPRQVPILSFGLTAPEGRPDLAELKRIARRRIAPAVEQLDGVAQLRVIGGRDLEVQVRLDPERLDAFGITVSEVKSRIAAANLDINAGSLQEGSRVYLVHGMARFQKPEDVASVIVRYQQGAGGEAHPICVSDLATVQMAPSRVESLVRVNGVEGVGLEVYKENGGNTVEVSRRVRRALKAITQDMPGVQLTMVGDEARLVESAISGVEGAALIGIFLAVAVLVFFLRSPGSTIIVAAAVPVSLLAAVLGMALAGRSLNLLSLGGLALGAGMLVDNAVVVVESIFRRRKQAASLEEAVVEGTAGVGGAIVASTLTTCIVFLPVLFVHGLAARLVSGLAFTVIASLSMSLLAAIFLIPALARWLLPVASHGAVDPGAEKIQRIVSGLLRHSRIVLIAALLVSVASILGLARLGTRLLPPTDPRQFSLRLVAEPGLKVENTSGLSSMVEEILRKSGGNSIEAILSEIGRVPQDERLIREEQMEENTARIRVRLRPEGVSVAEIIRKSTPALKSIRGLDFQWETGNSLLGDILGGRETPVEILIEGSQLEELRDATEMIREKLSRQQGVVNVRTSFEGGPPELRMRLQRPIAEALGVGYGELSPVVEASLDGLEATRMIVGDEEYKVRIFLPPPEGGNLGAVPLSLASGLRVPVGAVTSLEKFQGAREIFRKDQRRVARVTARLSEGRSLPDIRRKLTKMLDNTSFPPGVRGRLAGEEDQRRETLFELKWAAALAMLLVLMVLSASFESLRHPLTILSVLPVSMIGVAMVMIPVGRPLGVMAFLGLIVLAGVAVNDTILFVDAARRLHADGMAIVEAAARAVALRLRPILMTTATTVLALLPLAFGGGEAAALRAPMALCLIGGLLASTAASLFVIPCLFIHMER